MIKRFIILAFLLLFSGSGWAVDYYVDNEWTGTKSGTFAQPYDNVSDVSISNGDNIYIRCGSDETLSSTWTITNTNVTVTAYYDSGGTSAGQSPTGSAILESASPSFGSTCGNSHNKPILRRGSDATPDLTLENTLILQLDPSGNQYFEINSIHFRVTEKAIDVDTSQNDIRYCWFYDVGIGVNIGQSGQDADYNTVEYNHFDSQDQINEDGLCNGGANNCGVDMVYLGSGANNNTIQNNTFTGYDHGAVQLYYADSNTVQNNYGYTTNGHEDFFVGFNFAADSNIIRYNYSNSAGQAIEIFGGNYNEIYGNVFVCNQATKPSNGQGCIDILAYTNAAYDSSYNKIYNNVIYDADNNSNRGIRLAAVSGRPADVIGNEIYNNAIYKIGRECIVVIAETALISGYEFYNNICDDYSRDGSYSYAQIEIFGDTTYNYTATQLNSQSYASGNVDDNPDFKNVSLSQFWPTSTDDGMVANQGYDLGASYDDLLDPDNTDFAGPFGSGSTAPSVTLEQQEDQHPTWIIGAYGLEDDAPASIQQVQGVICSGCIINQ